MDSIAFSVSENGEDGTLLLLLFFLIFLLGDRERTSFDLRSLFLRACILLSADDGDDGDDGGGAVLCRLSVFFAAFFFVMIVDCQQSTIT